MENVALKSQLNVVCQKMWQQTPNYQSTQAGGSMHAPTWDSVCTLPDGRKFAVSGVLGSRKTAEGQAALEALTNIETDLASDGDVVTSAAAPMPAARRDTLREGEMQTEKVTVLIDTDNIAFIDAGVCARYPYARFAYYASFQRNLPFVDTACARCSNASRRDAKYAGSDVCDVMILFDAVRLVDYHSARPPAGGRKIVVVSGDKLLYNAERLLAPHVSYLGALAPLLALLDSARPQ